MYIRYLNFPTVPEYLIEPVADIVAGPFTFDAGYFKSRSVNSDLMSWLQTIFPYKISALYQISNYTLPIHVDVGIDKKIDDRIFAINYILESGGDQVFTNVYDSDKTTVLQSVKIETQRWHYLTTHEYHGLTGLTPERQRVSISITTKNQTAVFRNLFNYIMVP